MFCPSCGKQIADDVKFCPECGSEVRRGGATPAGPAPAPAPEPPSRKVPKVAVIAGIAVVAVLAVTLAAFALPGLLAPRDFQGTLTLTMPGQDGKVEFIVDKDEGTAELALSGFDSTFTLGYGNPAEASVIGDFERTGERDGSGEYTFTPKTVESMGMSLDIDSIASMYGSYMTPEQSAMVDALIDDLEVTVVIPDGAASGKLEGTWGIDGADLVEAAADVSGQSASGVACEFTLTVDADGTCEAVASTFDGGPDGEVSAKGSWSDEGDGEYVIESQGSELSIVIEN